MSSLLEICGAAAENKLKMAQPISGQDDDLLGVVEMSKMSQSIRGKGGWSS